MKIIEAKMPWWAGVQYVCGCCGSTLELEQVNFKDDHVKSATKTTVNVQCPLCAYEETVRDPKAKPEPKPEPPPKPAPKAPPEPDPLYKPNSNKKK